LEGKCAVQNIVLVGTILAICVATPWSVHVKRANGLYISTHISNVDEFTHDEETGAQE